MSVTGADPLAVTNSGMRPAALAAQGRFFELRNALEREAQTSAAYRGIELEELDTSHQVGSTHSKMKADLCKETWLPLAIVQHGTPISSHAKFSLVSNVALS